MKKKDGFIGGALVLMLFGLASKVIGAVYRIPLTSIIGAEGMGLYQMVFPLYTLMLTISSSGLPSSISKLIASDIAKNNFKQAGRTFRVSLVLLVCFSFVCSLFVLIFARSMALIQGNSRAEICYYGLIPAIIFVGLLSGFRGYFQGFQRMAPSAVSGFIEQLIKMFCGLFFSNILIHKGVEFGVFGALLGVSTSEFVALIYLMISYYLFKRKNNFGFGIDSGYLCSKKQTIKNVLSLSIFVTFGGLIVPLTMIIDSGVVINTLKTLGFSEAQSTALFGIQTGTVGSIINMPVVLSLGISTAILPCVSSFFAKGDKKKTVEMGSKALLLTILFALPASIGIITFAKPCILLLYGKSLSAGDLLIAVDLLQVAGISVFYLAMVQVCTGLLQGVGKFKVPLIALSVGGIIKIVLNLVLVRIPNVGILGAEFASCACYLCALFINLIALKRQNMFRFDLKIFVIFILSLSIYFSKYIFEMLQKTNLNYFLSFFITVVFVVCIYFVLIFALYRRSVFNSKTFKKNK